MTAEEYRQTRERIAVVAGLVKQLPLGIFLRHMPETEEPFIREMAKALKEVQALVDRQIGTPHAGHDDACDCGRR